MRNPRKSPIKTRNLKPLGSDASLVVWRSILGTNIDIPLEDWQLNAIQKLLGIEITQNEQEIYTTEYPRELVEENLKKISDYQIVVDD